MTTESAGWPVRILPADIPFRGAPDTDLLTGACRAGINIRWACRNGVCELCEGQLVAGKVLNTRSGTLVSAPSAIVLCRSLPRGPIEVEMNTVMAAGTHTPQTVRATVDRITPLSDDVYHVVLRMRHRPAFHAGQYLSIERDGEEPSYFSIASSPSRSGVELHIQADPDGGSAQDIMQALRSERAVTLNMPGGKACLDHVPDDPLVLVAAGTGFAQMKSVIDYLCDHERQAPVWLYWGVRKHEDMYLRAQARQWQDELPWFHFIPVVGDDDDNDWSGHHDQLARAVVAGSHHWHHSQVLASGSPAMVYTLLDALVDAGLPEDAFLSDVFEYAPR
ncbi:NAD(P)H-flavin reductase [Tamilnaduibacter salinus]|uniref:NAD(P)H-flavin reductase n=1 Tax=Tamilnaduibacter salinus TaxID=1484056 RepID=A0A2A2I070_9GAMM|nr:2Fe-2S iron-sulfur cluster-binding protein [Tamilnaduibacter salinus]PAV25411.1 NAD(P)H-flavin reductase [Tamilnaduibacter salinus]